ncbi:MAG: HAD family phosphatase [Dehalococcoidia bacterium]|nr:HAD family phosphatase [Dehalococcoidia bacterium]MSQ35351.1 HAD family phosphatase [Dehalococcoidia bacterium]
MIKAFIFDLDGTLVETEEMKAKAYALVSQRLLGLPAPDARAISLYKILVGSTDEAVSLRMLAELDLEDAVKRASPSLPGESGTWQALHRLRMDVYRARVGTPEAIRANRYEHNLTVLRAQKAAGRKVAVATSSYTDEARRVLAALGVLDLLDLVIGRDMAKHAKPDPEIYLLTMKELRVQPEESVIIEDSPVGLAAAVASGARWVCVATEFSRDALRARRDIDQNWVVYEPARVGDAVARRLKEDLVL